MAFECCINCRNRQTSSNAYAEAQWPNYLKSPLYLLFRWVIVVLFIAASVISFQEHFAVGGHWANYFIYLTNWGINLCLITSVFGSILSSLWYFRPRHAGSDIGLSVYWCLHNVSLIYALVITTSYWGFLYKPDLHVIDAANIATHLCNSIFMLLDFCVLVYPLRWHQVPVSLGLGAVYALFSRVYHAAGGTNRYGKPYIYSALNWEDPTKALTLVAGLFFMMLAAQILICGIHYMWFRGHRRWVTRKPTMMEIHTRGV